MITLPHSLAQAAHVAAVLVVVLLLALAGRAAARRLRQPEVIGEITVGLLAGPTVLHLLGPGTFDVLLPGPVLEILKSVAKAGLVLFLVGIAHRLALPASGPDRRAGGWVAAGALFPPLLAGVLLAWYVVAGGDAAVRGDAPLPAFVLMVAVTLSITAVPVMARILADRGMSTSAAGRLALSAAVVIDAVGWLLCMLAVSLGSGSFAGFVRSLSALAVAGLCALTVRYALRTPAAHRLFVQRPRTAAVLLGAVALTVALGVEHLGMTAILPAALVGLAIPAGAGTAWERPVRTLTRAGNALVPAFFVSTGITVLAHGFARVSWGLLAATVLLACAGKGGGGYLGARLGGRPHRTALEIAVLMNARGLTELIVLQAGLAAGVLTAPLVLALTVMALVTTAATGPLLGLLHRAGTEPALAPKALATEGSPR
ncbi:cation:proton antiporter [Streptomyces olivochromogenes]|uniref:Cation/H(+) antiporter n=1 Tax=Streptomyces olivochromogenes TaxID=1963 RepID=A0A250VCR2_STROL|nr:cation:proton antiporter [Streptomyces olivochromogenes]KUN45304.1 hypothetical protein AQJ27_20280 [Streptomyces olivochromogenes]GAX51790.1 cation/H(+) antiporter [Streptomyces olivochromogenes]